MKLKRGYVLKRKDGLSALLMSHLVGLRGANCFQTFCE